MPRTRECDFCGTDIEPGTGTMLVLNDGTTHHFCSAKCEKNTDLGREPRDVEWTEAGQRAGDRRAAAQAEADAERAEAEAEEAEAEAEEAEAEAEANVEAEAEADETEAEAETEATDADAEESDEDEDEVEQ
ncbi:50S ribosomal protein L24e [Halosegnis sp.]|uniref:50S ribosomal protein L24e n=1 Tax=Halosegnis sp. TaxID=2864959 RepID=UPI0035D43DE8